MVHDVYRWHCSTWWELGAGERRTKVNRSQMSYKCWNKSEVSARRRMQGVKVVKVDEFKYQGSTERWRKGGRQGWRRVSGVFCDRRIPQGSLIRQWVCWIEKRQSCERRRWRWRWRCWELHWEWPRWTGSADEQIRGTAKGGDELQVRLRWFRHVLKRDSKSFGQRMLRMEMTGKERRGKARKKRRRRTTHSSDL